MARGRSGRRRCAAATRAAACEFGFLARQRGCLGLRVGHAPGLRGFGASGFRGLRGLLAFRARGLGFARESLGFLGSDLRLQALLLELAARLLGVAACRCELQTIVLALERRAFAFGKLRLRGGARDVDAALGDIDRAAAGPCDRHP